jgi:hypothetical protein
VQPLFDLLDAQKLRRPRISFCLARGEYFAMPFGRLDFLRFLGKRSSEPFHRLKPLGFAQAGHFFLQFKDAHFSAIIAAASGTLKNFAPNVSGRHRDAADTAAATAIGATSDDRIATMQG